jgi:hypothetical protein
MAWETPEVELTWRRLMMEQTLRDDVYPSRSTAKIADAQESAAGSRGMLFQIMVRTQKPCNKFFAKI